jgi:hypothetical protein
MSTLPKNKGFNVVLAANLPKEFGGLAIYIKYKNGPKKVTLKERTARHAWFVCPDREVVIVRESQKSDSFVPYGDNFDECIDVSTYNDFASSKMGIKYVMTNFVHAPTSKNCRLNIEVPLADKVTHMCDSGGLQLAVGVKSYINPIKLMEYYDNNVDAGMALDFPLHLVEDESILKRTAIVQAKHNKIMLEHSRGTELINIFHGTNNVQRREYRSIVENPKIKRCAIGGIYKYSILTAIDLIVDIIYTQPYYKQYHILGVFDASFLPVLVKLANTGIKPHITSDSTSHIQSAVNRIYHFQFDLEHHMKRHAIGSNNFSTNSFRHLPCQCPVCVSIKYMDIFASGPTYNISPFLAVHNAYEMVRTCNALQEACASLTPKEYTSLVLKQFDKKSNALHSVKQSLHYIDVINTSSVKKARDQYVNLLSGNSKKIMSNGIFEKTDRTKKEINEKISRFEAIERRVKDVKL